MTLSSALTVCCDVSFLKC